MAAIRSAGQWLGSAGSVLAILAPKGLCPLCVAASGGVLSAVGLGFLAVDSTLRWVLPAVLIGGLAGLAIAARGHRRWWLLPLGAVGSVVLYLGWFSKNAPLLYSGMVLLTSASALSFWSTRHPRAPLVDAGRSTRGDAHAQG